MALDELLRFCCTSCRRNNGFYGSECVQMGALWALKSDEVHLFIDTHALANGDKMRIMRGLVHVQLRSCTSSPPPSLTPTSFPICHHHRIIRQDLLHHRCKKKKKQKLKHSSLPPVSRLPRCSHTLFFPTSSLLLLTLPISSFSLECCRWRTLS